ncbi:hypothetical protein L5515_004914 [Caenorhabditis briggsae]|uniref:BTB domain-containing protein n=1 Tax=Caenorhabditis briggsae TaxID=6238 RepID=A0AAE9EP56_CAEBR|nr:hypothetical protein L5515_004914 [Caenorhabditis briggsae]
MVFPTISLPTFTLSAFTIPVFSFWILYDLVYVKGNKELEHFFWIYGVYNVFVVFLTLLIHNLWNTVYTSQQKLNLLRNYLSVCTIFLMVQFVAAEYLLFGGSLDLDSVWTDSQLELSMRCSPIYVFFLRALIIFRADKPNYVYFTQEEQYVACKLWTGKVYTGKVTYFFPFTVIRLQDVEEVVTENLGRNFDSILLLYVHWNESLREKNLRSSTPESIANTTTPSPRASPVPTTPYRAPTSFGNILKLNIGGMVFQTTKATFAKYDGMLKTMLETNAPIEKDELGAIFIDRDPYYFRYILSSMRDGFVEFPNSSKEEKPDDIQVLETDGQLFKVIAKADNSTLIIYYLVDGIGTFIPPKGFYMDSFVEKYKKKLDIYFKPITNDKAVVTEFGSPCFCWTWSLHE